MNPGIAPLPDGRSSVLRNPPPTEPRPSGRGAGRFEYRHTLSLFTNHVLDRSLYGIRRPQVLRTAMSRPAVAVGSIQTALVQRAAAISFHRCHRLFRFAGNGYDDMYVIGANVNSPQSPTAAGAHIQQASQHDLAAYCVQPIRLLRHPPARALLEPCVCFRQRSAKSVLGPRNRSGPPGQPSAITDPGNQEGRGASADPSLTVGVLLGQRVSHPQMSSVANRMFLLFL